MGSCQLPPKRFEFIGSIYANPGVQSWQGSPVFAPTCDTIASMLRRTVTGLAMLSLLLCLATAALWARSYWRLDIWTFVGSPGAPGGLERYTEVESCKGTIMIEWVWIDSTAAWPIPKWDHNSYAANQNGWVWQLTPAAYPCFYYLGISNDSIPQREIADPSTLPDGTGRPAPAGYYHGVLYARHWLPMLVFMVLPVMSFANAVRWRRARQKYRRAHGLCLVCGYDLRATAGRCPECGTPRVRCGHNERQ
jgi:hypothetical protein